jgi:LPS sulfotransferase NodH
VQIFEIFPELRAPGFTVPVCGKPAVMVAMTARSGSSHLCKVLAAAGDFGQPNEIFNPRGNVQDECVRLGVSRFDDYLNALTAKPAGHFLFKTCWQDFAPFAAVWRQIFPDLTVVYLERKNIAAQAISLYKAKTTNLWHKQHGEAHKKPPPVPYNYTKIKEAEQEIIIERQAWADFFRREGLTPPRLLYEDFETDITKALDLFEGLLGVPLRRDLPANVGLIKLADEESKALLSAYWKQDCGLT